MTSPTMTSPAWGNTGYPITQAFGNQPGGQLASWYRYSADWGYAAGTHIALDIGMPVGTPLYAAVAGTAVRAGENLTYNRPGEVVLEYQIGDSTEQLIYAHMWTVDVSPGQHVTAGQKIGTSGEQTQPGTRIPDGSGPHLHIERRDITRMKALDPTPILTGSSAVPSTDRGNWPTAEKIDEWIEHVNKTAPDKSPLTGMGSEFVKLGERYGINPGVVTAIIQKESRMGADGSVLPREVNNYAGIMATNPADGYYLIDRHWAVYGSPREGLEAVFKLLDTDLYRDTGGRLEDVIELYSPSFENDPSQMFRNMGTVGDFLGITINRDTNIYERGSGGSGGSGDVGAIFDMLESYGPRIGIGLIGVLILAIGAIVLVGDKLPIGRLVKGVKGAIS